MLIRPNFFILGAPKCGTTSLADWLRTHPRVCMASLKEPHYFNTDSGHRDSLDLAHYESFFSHATPFDLAIGEASVWYLISDVAVTNILEYQTDARFIVCVRNPIDMTVSLHDEMYFGGDEPISDFVEAWKAQEGRWNGTLPRPSVCPDLRFFMYGPACKLGSQLERLYGQVPHERVHVVVMDDMKKDPGAVYRGVLQFLEVPDDGRTNFPVSNQAKERRAMWVRRLMRKGHFLKQRLGIKRGTGLMGIVNRWNQRQRKRHPLSQENHAMLVDYFKEDVQLLERLLGRDLGHWLRG